MADHLRSLGYTIELQKFFFSPTSLRAFPLFGAGLGGLAIALLPLLYLRQAPPWAALAVWAAGLAALLILVTGVGLGWVPLGVPAREDANVIATRGSGGPPRRWIVAHLDSKAQGHSMAGRLIAVWITVLATVSLSVLAVARLNAPLGIPWLVAGAALALVASFLAGKGQLRGHSPGARDNGSGVVAALTAAEASTDPGTGILITGAEEFGLVGARVFAQLMAGLQDVEFVNVDTVDDEGTLALVSHDGRGQRLAARLQPSLSHLGMPVRSRRLPIGIFVDSAPLARVATAITIGRLTWRTLQRIHTPADTADGFALETARRIGKALASN